MDIDNIDQVISSSSPLQKTLGIKSIIGAEVISKNGHALGKVADVRASINKMRIEGITVKGHSPMYIGSEYIEKVNPDAILLNITPSILLKGKKVMTYEGKIIGKVTSVRRREQTNDVRDFTVKSFMKKESVVPASAIKMIGTSVMLQRKYHVGQKYIWQRA